jgi:Trypsin-like peptidase domain
MSRRPLMQPLPNPHRPATSSCARRTLHALRCLRGLVRPAHTTCVARGSLVRFRRSGGQWAWAEHISPVDRVVSRDRYRSPRALLREPEDIHYQVMFRTWPAAIMTVLFAASLATANESTPRRALPDDNLAYPVLVEVPLAGNPGNASSGTGFYLDVRGYTFLITARHVVFASDTDTLKGKQMKLTSYGQRTGDVFDLGRTSVLGVDLSAMKAADRIVEERSIDAMAIPIATPGGEGSKVNRVEGVSGTGASLFTVNSENTKRFDEVLVGNDVFVFGYPSAIGLSSVPQLDYSRPLLRKGIVAGLNEKKRTIILDLATYGGNSGGPVLEVDRAGLTTTNYRVIGLVTSFIPTMGTTPATRLPTNPNDVDNSGYSVAIPIETVFEMLERHGIATRPSEHAAESP